MKLYGFNLNMSEISMFWLSMNSTRCLPSIHASFNIDYPVTSKSGHVSLIAKDFGLDLPLFPRCKYCERLVICVWRDFQSAHENEHSAVPSADIIRWGPFHL